jgi:hypothetical protein
VHGALRRCRAGGAPKAVHGYLFIDKPRQVLQVQCCLG